MIGIFNMTAFWAVVMIVSIVVEMATVGLASIWFCFGALAALLLSLFTDSILLQVAVFVAESLLLLVFTRPVAIKFINAKKVKTNLEAIAGSEVRVTENVDNALNTGKAVLNGLEWTARSVNEADVFQKEELAVVARVEGVKLILEKAPQPVSAMGMPEEQTQVAV